MKFLQCAICKKDQSITTLYKENFDLKKVNEKTFSARRTENIFHYRFNRCSVCGLIFSSPIFDEKRIISLYAKSEFNYQDETEFLKETYCSYLEKYFKKSIKSSKILDVGCGNGFFLEGMHQLGARKLYGVEPSADAIEKAPKFLRSKIKKNVLKKGIFSDSSFDLVSCFHTLDHITDPNLFIKTVWGLLKKDGAAYFIVHDTDGLSVKIFGEKSPIFDIEHIYLFNKQTLGKIFKQNGFRKVNVFPIKNIYPLEYWLKRSPLPKVAKEVVGKILQATKLGKYPLKISAGNIGIIAYK